MELIMMKMELMMFADTDDDNDGYADLDESFTY